VKRVVWQRTSIIRLALKTFKGPNTIAYLRRALVQKEVFYEIDT